VLLVGVGIVLFAYNAVQSTSLTLERDRITANALAQARQALIGRAVADNLRPGSLPCPDIDNDGDAESPVAFSGVCPMYIGQLPWKTLGLPDLRDGEGERLWYALSNNFLDFATAEPINSDTRGNRTVHSQSTAVTLTTEAVAVVFAPGAVTGAQIRDTVLAMCPTTGITILRNRCAANYLEATGGANNAALNGAGPFISASRTPSFNDRLLVITTAELMPPIEQRVARELRRILQNYRAGSGCACYPWADTADGYSDTSSNEKNRGRIPLLGAAPNDWSDAGVTIPSWILNNDWRLVTYYAVARNSLQGGGGACSSGYCQDATLSVDLVPNKEVVLIMPGPAGVSGAHTSFPSNYFEDPENNDHANDRYVTPSSTAYARDRIYTIP